MLAEPRNGIERFRGGEFHGGLAIGVVVHKPDLLEVAEFVDQVLADHDRSHTLTTGVLIATAQVTVRADIILDGNQLGFPEEHDLDFRPVMLGPGADVQADTVAQDLIRAEREQHDLVRVLEYRVRENVEDGELAGGESASIGEFRKCKEEIQGPSNRR